MIAALARLSTLLLAFALLSPATASEAPRYRVSVQGPIISANFSCDDPCEEDRSTVVGKTEGTIVRNANDSRATPPTGSRITDEDGPDYAAEGITCTGECSTASDDSLLTFQAPRQLREGMKLTIRDNRVHFIFYTVTDTEQGPATLLQHSELRIDRPLIEVSIRDHDVIIETEMADSERTDIMRRREG